MKVYGEPTRRTRSAVGCSARLVRTSLPCLCEMPAGSSGLVGRTLLSAKGRDARGAPLTRGGARPSAVRSRNLLAHHRRRTRAHAAGAANSRQPGARGLPSGEAQLQQRARRPDSSASVSAHQGKCPVPRRALSDGPQPQRQGADPYQKCCQALARLGYAVLAFDPFGQGERTYYGVHDADEEHSRADARCCWWATP